MKNDVFSAWFKELCSLVFVQTFQAFLLAIVMSIIVRALANSPASLTGGLDAVGVLAIVALASFSKIELLIKNIFGLTSGQGDPSLANGRSSLVGGLVAFGSLRRVADNGRKLIGGVGKAVSGQVRLRKAQNKLYPLEAAELEKGTEEPEKRTITGYRSGTGNYTEKKSKDSDKKDNGNITGDIGELTKELAKLNETLSNQALQNNRKDKEDKIAKLKETIDSAKKVRDEGLKSAFKGVTESIGTVTGATAGALYGLAQGENIAQSTVTGAGVGDVVGETVANITINTGHVAKSVKKIPDVAKEEIKYHQNKDVYKKIDQALKNKENLDIKNLNQKLENYKKNQNVKSNPKSIKDV